MASNVDGGVHIYREADGSWRGHVTIATAPDGRPVRRHIRGKTRAEIVHKLGRLQRVNEAKRQEGSGKGLAASGQGRPAPAVAEGPSRVPNARILLKVEEAAEVLAISRWKVFELIRRDELHTVKIGGLRRVPRTAIDEYVAWLAGEGP